MQVADLLALPVIQKAGATVLVGEDHVDREVRWVHSGEIADIAQYLLGGEVLLTAATGLRDNAEDRRRYIRELADAGVAALIVELGRGFKVVPDVMIDEARKQGLVLIALERDVPFVAVTHIAHTELISSAHADLLRAIEIDDALSRLILDGAPLAAVLELLSDRLRNPVILEDRMRRVVAFGRGSGALAPILRDWKQHSRTAHDPTATASVHMAECEPRCAWTEIALRGEVWGRLHVIQVDNPLEDVVRLALGRASASIALHLMAERDAYLSVEAEHALVRAIASASDFNSQDFTDRAVGLGVNLDSELVLLATRPPHPAREPSELDDPSARVVRAVRAAFGSEGWPAVVGAVDDVAVAIASGNVKDGVEASATRVAEALAEELGAQHWLGVSRPCTATALPRAFEEARAAQRLAPLGEGTAVQFYDDLVLQRLLSPLLTSPELAGFVESELGALIARDEQSNSELVATLDAFLQTNGNKQTTGELLHLRRRSVYYRLERIEKILGCSLESPDRRARLYLALRARELLEDRPAQAV